MGYQEVTKISEEGYPPLPNNPTDAHKIFYKENKKKDCKSTFLIPQCVYETHFEKIAGSTTSQEAWKILEIDNEDAEKLKKVRMQTMKCQIQIDANGKQ